MGDEPDLDPEINREFFESNLLQLDPALLTEAGIRCFERFFKAVNCKEGKLIPKRRAHLMDDLELVGLDYCWRVVLCSDEDVASKAIELLKETFTNLGPRLQAQHVDIHEDFVSSFMDRLRASFDTITVVSLSHRWRTRARQSTVCACPVITPPSNTQAPRHDGRPVHVLNTEQCDGRRADPMRGRTHETRRALHRRCVWSPHAPAPTTGVGGCARTSV